MQTPLELLQAKCDQLERELRRSPDFQLYLLAKSRTDRARMESVFMQIPQFALWRTLTNSVESAPSLEVADRKQELRRMSPLNTGLCTMMMLGSLSTAFAKVPAPTLPYGTPAEQQQCINKLEVSLNGQSPLGSRDGPEYIQDLGELQSEGLTEYDLLVDRCRNELYHEYLRAHGGKITGPGFKRLAAPTWREQLASASVLESGEIKLPVVVAFTAVGLALMFGLGFAVTVLRPA